MDLIWTYNSTVSKYLNHTEEQRIILLSTYKKSIRSAIKLGYYTIIYTDVPEIFEDIVHECISCNSEFVLWDSYKFIPLKERNSDFVLIDGDVILHDTIKFSNSFDVYFDTYEINTLNGIYRKDVKKLTELGIESVIPEWISMKDKVMNCGILYIRDKDFRDIYVNRWEIFNDFILKHSSVLDLRKCTAIGAQYLLTILCIFYNKTSTYFSKRLREPNESYIHYSGMIKYDNPIRDISTDKYFI